MAHQVAQYDESIRYVDDQLRRLNDEMKAAGRNVRWVITSDHGEEFGERGSWGHAHTLYAEQLRIPLVFSGQGLPSRSVDQGWVGSHDIAPTLLEWVGQEFPSTDGIDLNPYFVEKALPERVFLAETSRFKTNKVSLLEGEYRLEWNLRNGKKELFNPMEDPTERTDISASNQEMVDRLMFGVEAFLGHNWESKQDGEIIMNRAVGLHNGRKSTPMKVRSGETFLLMPFDAEFWYRETKVSEKEGPFSTAVADQISKKDPIKFIGGSSTSKVELSEENKRRLEEMGYLQKEE